MMRLSSTGVYRSNWIFIQGYIPIMFKVCNILIIYYSRAIYLDPYFAAVARKKNEVKVNINLGRTILSLHSLCSEIKNYLLKSFMQLFMLGNFLFYPLRTIFLLIIKVFTSITRLP